MPELAAPIDARDDHRSQQYEGNEARHDEERHAAAARHGTLAQRFGATTTLACQLGQLGGRDAHAKQAHRRSTYNVCANWMRATAPRPKRLARIMSMYVLTCTTPRPMIAGPALRTTSRNAHRRARD